MAYPLKLRNKFGRFWHPMFFLSVDDKRWSITIVFLVTFLPLLFYGLFFQGGSTVTALEARRLLKERSEQFALVDIREAVDYAAGHIVGATNWPYAEILNIDASKRLPEELHGKFLLLICESGLKSDSTARHLEKLSIEARSVRGGMQSWTSTANKAGDVNLPIIEAENGSLQNQPYLHLSQFEQIAGVSATALIKPAYMLLALLIIVVLRHGHSKDLMVLRWAMVFFLAGELACVFNTASYFVGGDQSDLFEFLHGVGMTLSLWLLFQASWEAVDRRLLKRSVPRRTCALLPLCRVCYKYQAVDCKLKRLLTLLIPIIAILTLIPMTASLHSESYNVELFGMPYNFTRPIIHQIYELRYLPLLSLALLATAYILLLKSKGDPVIASKAPLTAGSGILFYSVLMLTLHTVFLDNMVWFVFWEEGTELALLLTIAAVLAIFRKGLFTTSEMAGSAAFDQG